VPLSTESPDLGSTKLEVTNHTLPGCLDVQFLLQTEPLTLKVLNVSLQDGYRLLELPEEGKMTGRLKWQPLKQNA
jgi:hypothetical protein